MPTLIVTLVFGLLIAFFASQNTDSVSLHFLQYSLQEIPIYIVVVGSLLVGIFTSWIISLVNEIGAGVTIWGKDKTIKEKDRQSIDLTKHVHQLELENEKLKTKLHVSGDEKSL